MQRERHTHACTPRQPVWSKEQSGAAKRIRKHAPTHTDGELSHSEEEEDCERIKEEILKKCICYCYVNHPLSLVKISVVLELMLLQRLGGKSPPLDVIAQEADAAALQTENVAIPLTSQKTAPFNSK